MEVAILLFEEFETLDVFGPVEILGRLTNDFDIKFYSLNGGNISNSHGVTLDTHALQELKTGSDVFLIPGGYGTRTEVKNDAFLTKLREICELSTYVLTVCTGTALLAKTGLLDGRKATTNKIAFDWVISNGPKVNWIKKARWVIDGKFHTSSGVTAGMDMTLDFLKTVHGIKVAREIAEQIEYTWIEDSENDSFYRE